MKILFKANGPLEEYHSERVNFKDGETASVEDGLGSYLLATFPHNFSAVPDRKAAAKEKEAPKPKNRAIAKDAVKTK